jgi:hypothetical protein
MPCVDDRANCELLRDSMRRTRKMLNGGRESAYLAALQTRSVNPVLSPP